jgi:hypothetical protein
LRELRSENTELGERQNAILESSLHLQGEQSKLIEELAEEMRQVSQERERLWDQVTASQQRMEALVDEVRLARQQEVRLYQDLGNHPKPAIHNHLKNRPTITPHPGR